jgi:hypothetical protein
VSPLGRARYFGVGRPFVDSNEPEAWRRYDRELVSIRLPEAGYQILHVVSRPQFELLRALSKKKFGIEIADALRDFGLSRSDISQLESYGYLAIGYEFTHKGRRYVAPNHLLIKDLGRKFVIAVGLREGFLRSTSSHL